jgi:hypothetical protein
MKRCLLLLILLGMIQFARSASAQCVYGWIDVPYACNSSSCQDSGTMYEPNGQGAYQPVMVQIYCCGVPVGSSISYYFNCMYVQLRDPATQQRLLDLAKESGEELLVASCKGDFQPLRTTLWEPHELPFRLRKPNLLPPQRSGS